MLLLALKDLYERKLAGRRAYWRIRNELDSSTDRDLRDLGVSRCDIEGMARQAARAAETAARKSWRSRNAKPEPRPAQRGNAPIGVMPRDHRCF